MLEIGTKAPSFSLIGQDGNEHALDEYLGKKLVLYFYPKDNTAGCTKQACGFASLYSQFQLKGVNVVGISKDSLASHKKFSDKYELPFTILSDESLEVLQAYDVWKEKKMAGRTYMGIVRTTYIIDEEGTIIYANDKVKAALNPEQMLGLI